MGRTGHCRQHILDAGIGVLSSKGYNGTGVKEIVDAAGVPKGSFYNHFVSKEAFVVEALEKVADESVEAIELILQDTSRSPKQRLLDFFDSNHQNHKGQEFSGGCLFGNLCLEMADENEAIRNTTSDIMCRVIKLIANCLKEAQSSGELSNTSDPVELAEFIHYAWEGSVMRSKGQRDCGPYDIFRKQLVKLLH